MNRKVEAIIFDLDGTLLDTLDDLADAANLAITAQGFVAHPADAYRFFIGDGLETLIRRAVPADVDEKTVGLMHEAMRAHYSLNWSNKTRPYDGIMDLLERLAIQNRPLAVLSNKYMKFTSLLVRRFFPHIPFEKVVGSGKEKRAKPDPAFALDIAREMKADPARIFLVGDSRTDMDTARAAGMVPVGALWGFRPQSELEEHGAKILLAHPDDLFDYL